MALVTPVRAQMRAFPLLWEFSVFCNAFFFFRLVVLRKLGEF